VKNQSTLADTKSTNFIGMGNDSFRSREGETILETLEREDVNVNFNCREGFCGVCRAKLLSGCVNYRVEPLAYIDDDEILTCCTIPTSDITINVEY
jgi:ferredoxin